MTRKPTYADKMRQANREAKATLIALALMVVVWIALGFGLAGAGVEIFHTPLWIIGGTVGTWLFSIAVAAFMSRRVIVDVDLDDSENDSENGSENATGHLIPARQNEVDDDDE